MRTVIQTSTPSFRLLSVLRITLCSYRKVIIRMFWEDQAEPSVLAPLGDFFCIGEGAHVDGSDDFRTLAAWQFRLVTILGLGWTGRQPQIWRKCSL